MDRRTFLTNAFNPVSQTQFASSSRQGRPLSSDLTPWVPNGTDVWDLTKVGHLLRRTMMMPLWSDMQKLASMSCSDAVDLLLSTPSTPTRPAVADHGTTSLDGLDVILISQMKATWASDMATLQQWWINTMISSSLSIIEKMVFFWSGHFTTQFDLDDVDYVQAPLLYRQNDLFRQNALGMFPDLVLGVTLDGAMLVFLGGNLNTVATGQPNENYARELMELFTMGLNEYSQSDVHEAARILTGWRIARYTDQPAPNGLFNTYFSPPDHDTGNKIYLNQSFPAIDPSVNTQDLVKKNEIEVLVNTIFSARGPAVAEFICRKIYQFFVYSDPAETDETIVTAMAQTFQSNNYQIKPVIAQLLKSQHFFDNINIGAQIKTPAEFTIGLARQLGYNVNVSANMTNMLQTIFQPPNVSGWSGWHDWITTNTFPVRASVAAAAISSMSDQQVLDFIDQFANNTDANTLITNVGYLMLPRPLSQGRHDDLVNLLVGGDGANKDYEWPTILSTSPTTAARNMRSVLTEITTFPDFQLC